MSNSDFNLDQVATNQSNKETTINSADDQLGSAFGNFVALDATSGNITLSQAQATRNMVFRRTDTTASRSITLYVMRRAYLIENSAVATNIIVGSTTIAMQSGETALFYTDGTANGLKKELSSVPATVTDIPGSLTLSGDISPTQLVANTNDWAPTGLAGALTIRVSTDVQRDLTGLTGGADGRMMIIAAIDNGLKLKDQSSSSSASNRFALGGSDVTLAVNQAALLQYDSTSSRWRLIGGTGSGGGGSTTFTALTDTFASYSGDAFKFVRVNSGETALEPFEIPYLIPMYGPGVYTNSQLVQRFKVVEGFRLPSGGTGSLADAAIASTGTVVFHIQKNGSDIGTVTFTASATGVFAVSGNQDFANGDVLSFVAPATADGTLADVSITLKCKRIA